MAKNTSTYIRNILIIGLLYLLFVALFSRTVADPDLWGYLSFGRIFWESGFFPFQDIFSYTPTKPLWVYHEWLTGVIFYPIIKHTGPAGLQFLRYLIIILTAYLIYKTALKKGANALSVLISLCPAMVLISFGYSSVVRAQIFTYLFFILTVFIIECARKDQKWLILTWLVPIQLLWCNLHGGFITGLGIIGLYAIGDALSGKKFSPFIIALFPATLITLLNPYGIEYWKFILHAAFMPRPEIDEWMSVTSALNIDYQFFPIVIFIILWVLCFLFLVFSPKKHLTEILIIVAISYAGFKHVRHTMFLGILFGAFSPMILSEMGKTFFQKQHLAKLSWFVATMLAVLLLSTKWSLHQSLPLQLIPSHNITVSHAYYPVDAIDWMRKNNVYGNILPHFSWGEFLIWECYPKCKVAMDGRYETVYPEAVYKEYFDFLMGREGWQSFLNNYHHDLVLIRPKTKINSLMIQHNGWKRIYSNFACSLFIKKDNMN